MKTTDINRIIAQMPLTMQAIGRLPRLKYRFSRANWYVAEFNIDDYTDVVHWCREQFGPHPCKPDAWSRWYHKYEDKIHFRDEKDYNWFMLRWGA
jgi:hypothetical protein